MGTTFLVVKNLAYGNLDGAPYDEKAERLVVAGYK